MVFEYISEGSVQLSELQDRVDDLEKVDKSVAILDRDKPVVYWVPAVLYEQMHKMIEGSGFKHDRM